MSERIAWDASDDPTMRPVCPTAACPPAELRGLEDVQVLAAIAQDGVERGQPVPVGDPLEEQSHHVHVVAAQHPGRELQRAHVHLVAAADPVSQPHVPPDQGLQEAVAERAALGDESDPAGPRDFGAQHAGEREVRGAGYGHRAEAVGADDADVAVGHELVEVRAQHAVAVLETAADDHGDRYAYLLGVAQGVEYERGGQRHDRDVHAAGGEVAQPGDGGVPVDLGAP